MDILIGIVIAFIIIVAVYVGFHAEQVPAEIGGHNISTELDILSESSKSTQTFQNYSIPKSIT